MEDIFTVQPRFLSLAQIFRWDSLSLIMLFYNSAISNVKKGGPIMRSQVGRIGTVAIGIVLGLASMHSAADRQMGLQPESPMD